MALSEGICWAGRASSLFAQDMGKAAFLMGRAVPSTCRSTDWNKVKEQRAGNAGKQNSLEETPEDALGAGQESLFWQGSCPR